MEKIAAQGTTTPNSSNGFDLIKNSTLCPFAEKSIITYGTAINPELPFADQVTHLYAQLQVYTASLNAGTFSDGFAAQLPASYFGTDIEGLAGTFLTLYEGLRALDDVSNNQLGSEIINRPGWQLTIAGQRMFTLVFSPIYPAEHARHSPDSENVYVLFQPESSFHERLDRERMDKERRVHLKQKIRERFAKGGRPYDPHDHEPPLEAPKYIKPVNLGEGDVTWWEKGQQEN